ncbi:hypothetical protein B9Z55_007697 [Caenorhabditis nigoni]|nr:hypothetical protein B9Z55_007697 [Caenorhabditis nigoni]
MTTNKEVDMGARTGPEHTVILGDNQILGTVTAKTEEATMKSDLLEEIKKDNQQKFDELSNRLQSIEASISKLSKCNEDAEKPVRQSQKEPLNVSTVTNNNRANMTYEKRFKLKHVFKNVKKFKENKNNYSVKEDHYNVKWSMYVVRKNHHIGFYVHCEPIDPSKEWSIQTNLELKIVRENQNDVVETGSHCYQIECGVGRQKFLGWEEMKKWYLVDGNLTVEAKVTIVETTGLRKKNIRKFDESQKDVSDVILVVRNTKFYVSKMFLASQSSVFKALLLGNFKESGQSEVVLNGMDPGDFHYFLEVLYGESAIDDINVEDIALLADMYDAQTAIRKCEEFLLKESKKTIEMKLTIATRYHLEDLEEKCMSDIKNIVSKNIKFSTKSPFRKMLCF